MARKDPWPVGQKITGMRLLTSSELDRLAWDEPGVMLKLDDGGFIIASRDPEGNGPGAFFAFPPGKEPMVVLWPELPPLGN